MITPTHTRLIKRVRTRLQDQTYDGTSDSAVIQMPFKVTKQGDDTLVNLAATEFWPCPTFYDPGYTYHFVTLRMKSGETMQLLVVAKKVAIALQGPALGFLKQSRSGVYGFKSDNVFVWAMPPVKNAGRKLAKTVYQRSATGFSAGVWAYFATDYMAALIISSENFEDVRDIFATEVLKVIDPHEHTRRMRRQKLNHGGTPIRLSGELRITQRMTGPALDIMARKLRVSGNAPPGKYALFGMQNGLKEDINAGTGDTLDTDKFLFSLACRKEHIVPEPRYSKGKSPRLCKEPKVVEKLLNVFDEEDVSE